MSEGDKVEWIIIKEAVENAEAIQRVRELHKPYSIGNRLFCQDCCVENDYCDPADYPCPTIEALDGEQ